MIEITNINERAPRAIRKARRTRPFVTKKTDNSYQVTPRHIAKQRRLVTFKVEAGRRFADCRDAHTSEQCPAVLNDLICYHIAAAARRAESNRKRKVARRAAAVAQEQAARSLPAWYGAAKIRGIRI